MGGDIHCQHKEHKKVVAYLVSDYESTNITNTCIVQLYVFIWGVTEDFQIVLELHYLALIKKGGDTILSLIGNLEKKLFGM
jgi:hypothetical protein